MSQRASGFARIPGDLYETPAWVTDALGEHVRLDHQTIWEPAAGNGLMVAALENQGASVLATDVENRLGRKLRGLHDFTERGPCPWIDHFDGIVTNPPYGPQGRLATAFIQRGLLHIAYRGFMALLLPVDFDAASTRAVLFSGSPLYAGKIVLTRRIKWFEGPSSPSQNHAWFLWQRSWLDVQQIQRVLYAPQWAPRKKVMAA